ncbi:DNA polymerase I [Yinghuangia seranimata]|uniref:DNA polymerase I n=1 Tax=Yinghuangia seranimata TaxID=408067 RepID=UPI00248B446F|nr:DNA polymerase I [Yinghuangia seranimata]MDI2126259.1 DNA polymerase I [Yinghuangia seranimata]
MASTDAPQASVRTGTRPRLLLLDGHSLAYRAFYALKEATMSTATGQPTQAVFGFASMLANVLRDEAPTHLGVAFDVSRQSFRTDRFPEYKANRSATPDEFKGQVELIIELLDAMGVRTMRVEGFEADDVIATVSTQAAEEGYEVLILTGDRDSLQLVTPDVTVLYPMMGVSKLHRFTPQAVEEKYQLTPQQYPDFAALRGDPSDNLPGIPGVGEKTAAKWIREFGSFQELVERADEVKGKAGENFRAHLEAVRLNRELTELVRDVPLEVGPADLERTPFDRSAVEQVLDALEFRANNFRDRLWAVDPGLATAGGEAEGAVVEDGFELDTTVLETGALGDWLAEHAAGTGRTGLAVDGTWGRGTGTVAGVAFAAADGTAAFVDASALDEADDAALAAWLADPEREKAVHDAKGPMLALKAHGWDLAGVTSDTALGAYLVLPGQRSFALETLTQRFLGRELKVDEASDSGQLALDMSGEDDAEAARGEALMLAARAVVDVAAELDEQLESRGALKLLQDMELPLLTVLARMERVGIAADRDHLDRLEAQFGAAVKQATEQAHGAVGRDFNLGSPKQLQEILFGELNLPKTKKIKTGYTTDADALVWLATQPGIPEPAQDLLTALLRHRDQSKLRVTVEGLIKTVTEDGRIHTTFHQTVAATGRLSSSDPNLQNIPIRTDEGRQIRSSFVVGDGYEGLLTADYSQIELRIMAHLSGDEALIDAFASGEDLHNTVASAVFEVPRDRVDAEMRRKIKAMSYGLAYGLSAFGLSQQLDITPEEARKLMANYFERFGGVRDYLRAVVDEARQTGYTETVFGRRRYLPDLTSDNRQRREMAERMALNAPIQGSAADIVKVAMLGVDKALTDGGFGSRILLQVHDELVLEIAPGERAAVEALVRREMAGAYPLRAPLDVSVGFGATWEDAGH